MKTTITYKGILNGVHGLWCGFKPEGLEVLEQITVYRPDEGKEFLKGEERFSAVVLQPGEKIEDYEEVDALPEPKNEPEEVLNKEEEQPAE